MLQQLINEHKEVLRMARKTIKGLEEEIKDLEQRLKDQNNINLELNKTISEMQLKADNSFENSGTYRQMSKQIEYLETVVKGHEISLKAKEVTIKNNRDTIQELLKEIEKLKSNNCVQKTKNERNAGRKSKIDDNIISVVTMLKLQGKSIRAIAKEIDLSVGTVHKIINEHIK